MEKYTPLAAQVRARRERFLYLEIVDFLFLGEQRSCDGRGGAQRPVWRVYEPKKTGARSARARTRGQNPLVGQINNQIRNHGNGTNFKKIRVKQRKTMLRHISKLKRSPFCTHKCYKQNRKITQLDFSVRFFIYSVEQKLGY